MFCRATKRSSLHKPVRVLLSVVTHVLTRLEPARWTTVVAGGKGMNAEVCCSGKEPRDVQRRRWPEQLWAVRPLNWWCAQLELNFLFGFPLCCEFL